MFNKALADWSSPLDHQRNELIFENRNKEYGAYIIRRDYDKSLLYAFITATFLLVGFIYANTFLSKSPIVRNLTDDGGIIITVPMEITPPPKEVKPLEPLVKPPTIEATKTPSSPNVNRGVSINNLVLTAEPVVNNTNVVVEGHADPLAPVITNVDPLIVPSPKPITGGGSAINSESSILEIGELERMPTPIGGPDAIDVFIRNHINYPQDAIEREKTGRVLIQFVIETDGSVSNVTVLKGIFASLDKEALRLVALLPKWNPGMSGGKPVRVYFRKPISFQLGSF